MKNRPIVAIMYDFDKTLSPNDMQEYGFIQSLKMKTRDFWNEVSDMVKNNEGMDNILSYMYLMINKASESKVMVYKNNFIELGKNIKYFDGVIDWFKRINNFAEKNNIVIEHYIISSGLKEIIEGTEIKKYFKAIYVCEFFYDYSGKPVWPKVVVNHTTKTQFLFCINKGISNPSKTDEINRYLREDDRRIPFRNMIYIGDGLTDIPCMKLVKVNGGQSIAVYKHHNKKSKGQVLRLLKDERVNFVTKADYSEGTELDNIVKTILKKICFENELILTSKEHVKKMVDKNN